MTNSPQLIIGPLRWVLKSDGAVPVHYSYSGYQDFYSPGKVDCDAVMASMEVQVSSREVHLPDFPPLYQAGSTWAVWEQGNYLIFCNGIQENQAPRAMLTLDRSLVAAALYLHPTHDAVRNGVFDSPLRYPLDQALSWGMLSRFGGLLIHGAVAVKDGVGYVFSGRSGAGKSTLANLCHQDGWVVLNDDRSLLFPRNGQWHVCGTPWHGSGRFAQPGEFPLGGMFLLHQAPKDRLEGAGQHHARLALLDVAAIPWFADDWCQQALDAVDQLVGHVPVRYFHFTRSASAVEKLESWIHETAGVPV